MLPQLSIQQHVTCAWVRVMLSCVKAKICRFRCLVLMTHSPTLAQLTVIQQQEHSSFPACLRLITQALQEDASIAQVSIPPSSPSSFSLTLVSYRVLNREKVFAQQFSKPGKSLQYRDKFWKIVYFCSAPRKPMKKSFVPAFFKVSIDHLFDNLESGKRNHCFGKKVWEKS